MKQTDTYSITVDEENIVIRLNIDLVDRDALTKLLDYILLESVRTRSALTEEQASMLSEEIDREIWARAKQKYTEA